MRLRVFLEYLWNSQLSHSPHSVPSCVGRVIAPATDMESKRPIWRKEWTTNYLKIIRY